MVRYLCAIYSPLFATLVINGTAVINPSRNLMSMVERKELKLGEIWGGYCNPKWTLEKAQLLLAY